MLTLPTSLRDHYSLNFSMRILSNLTTVTKIKISPGTPVRIFNVRRISALSQEGRPLLTWIVRLVRRDHLTRIGKDPQQLALEAVAQTGQQEILCRILFPASPQIYFPEHQRAGVRIEPGLKVRKLVADRSAPTRVLDDSHLFTRPGVRRRDGDRDDDLRREGD
jgi:hypothetical protein